ncbi:hypothetical protein LCM4577_32195 [Mesorhizobium sp. LCM 4577]|uniref:hypothetical protein n=1 Tax=Mesorhizobium sp. LCM 4577 TaxID=1848288 RepID=UPI0008D9267F|nr:hypothetical protein [Mesorhizobium sp. LCM 4577]OHV63569.1 hypothetical protein LCM4577_32195 [Mesorhizobium sp. LCM 4577]
MELEEVMSRFVEYQDGDVSVTSRKPLKGTLELVGEEDEPVYLTLDQFAAEWLMGALAEFLIEGEGGATSQVAIGRG